MRQKTDFDRFWDHGMKLRSGVGGNGPKPAAIFFNKLVKEGIDPERIIAGIAAYIHFIQPRVQPDKQPSAVKWLNEWRWEEDAGDGVALREIAKYFGITILLKRGIAMADSEKKRDGQTVTVRDSEVSGSSPTPAERKKALWDTRVQVRSLDPVTSHKAAAKAETKAGSHKRIIMDRLNHIWPAGETWKEIARATGLEEPRCWRRVSDLFRDGKIERERDFKGDLLEREGCRVFRTTRGQLSFI